jgi:hypothetical protein
MVIHKGKDMGQSFSLDVLSKELDCSIFFRRNTFYYECLHSLVGGIFFAGSKIERLGGGEGRRK